VTATVVTVTTVLTILQVPFPEVRLALWRDRAALAAGQWWRLVTPLLVQYDRWVNAVVVLACVAAVGVVAERVVGPWWWLAVYLGCGMVGQAFGYLWAPPDAGASVAGCGLLGVVSAWLLAGEGPRQPMVRAWGLIWPLAGVALTAVRDMHGPPLLLGFAAGMLLPRGRHGAAARPDAANI
jgi:rhomboid protease GluP